MEYSWSALAFLENIFPRPTLKLNIDRSLLPERKSKMLALKNSSFLNKRNFRLFLIAFAVICVCYSSIIRADYNYIDDLGHNYNGWPEWGFNFGRWIITLANFITQGQWILVDVSPFMQFLAIAVLSGSVLIMSYVFSLLSGNNQIRIRSYLVSFIIAFNPYFLECMSYKYDCIGMALSVLFPLVPFLFIGDRRKYGITSIICLLLMCFSYQASSGIYIIMVIFCGFLIYVNDRISIIELLKYYVYSALLYAVALVLFYIGITPFLSDTYRSIAVGGSILSALIQNGKLYFLNIMHDFNGVWKAVICLMVLAAVIAVFQKSRKNRVIKTVLFLILVCVGGLLSCGAYLVLAGYQGNARMLYGIGIFLAIIANLSVINDRKIYLAFPALYLLLLFVSFTFAYGNALNEQNEYEQRFEQMILNDINSSFPDKADFRISVNGTCGYSPIVEHVVSLYPIMGRLVPMMFNGSWWWSGFHLAYYNGFEKLPEDYGYSLDDMDLVCTRMLYNIYSKDMDIIVCFK